MAKPIEVYKSLNKGRYGKADPKEMAHNVVKAYVSHDSGKFEESAHLFSLVFRDLFPEYGDNRIKTASETYVDSLRLQDIVENNKSLSVREKINHEEWKNVKNALKKFCKALDIPESYAHETTQFFRYHGVRDSRYVQHVLNAERILSHRITGDEYWATVTGALYLACIECHDKHDANGFEMGKKFAEQYFSILLRARDKKNHRGRKKIW